jgi:hypothetical protein
LIKEAVEGERSFPGIVAHCSNGNKSYHYSLLRARMDGVLLDGYQDRKQKHLGCTFDGCMMDVQKENCFTAKALVKGNVRMGGLSIGHRGSCLTGWHHDAGL